MTPAEVTGGDPACWAHLFENEEDGAPGVVPVDLRAIAREAARRGPAWTSAGDDLNVNLLVFNAGEGVADHANTELDVLIVGVSGEGVLRVNGETHALTAGMAVVVPKGAVRSTRASSDRFAYLTCHRRRGGLFPTLPVPIS